MLLDYNETRRLLKGTPLQSLTNQQLKDAFVGEYPMMFSDKQVSRLWDKAMDSDKVQLERIKAVEAQNYLQHFKNQSIKSGKIDTANQIEKIERTINNLLQNVALVQLLSTMQLHQDMEIQRYEIELRRLKQIESNALES